MDEMKFSPGWRDTMLKVKPGLTGMWQIQGRGSTLLDSRLGLLRRNLRQRPLPLARFQDPPYDYPVGA